MPNRAKILKFIITIMVILVLVLLAWFGQGYFASIKTIAPAEYKLEINKGIYNNVANPKDFGQTPSPNEPGFGRDNPFAPYK